MTGEDKVIYTKYGNPYNCHFGNLNHNYEHIDGLISINAMGYCTRI